MTSTVAVVGLGQMGLPLAGRTATKHDVLAFDLAPERRALAKRLDGVRVTDDLADLADVSCVVLSLPTPAASRAVLRELAPTVRSGTLVVETSTVLPSDVRDWSALLAPAGARVIDAAVLSGVAQMERGAATLLVGGDASDVADARSILDALGGAGWTRLGDLGAGMAAKVVNNGVAHAVMVVLVEAFAMAKAQGLQLESIAEMLSRPDGGLVRPLTHRVMERVATGNYEGGMPLEAARKDSTLALAMAQRSGTPLFATQGAHTVYELAAAAGLGREDYAVVATLWEQWGASSLAYDAESDG
ncbi:NAD(P)-dependent oxidoreductase [Isoptericola cucumis]|uniref:NAD(P)-dependent oxidoreductase n=1 Tax=Isoptericola cucumis TaxID=1776856 RepID=UPI003207E27B